MGRPIRLLAFVFLAVLAAATLVVGARPASAQGRPAYRADEVIVKFRRDARAEDRASLRAQLRAERLREFGFINAERLRIRGMSVEQAIARLRNHPLVEYVEPNYEVRALVVPNDPMFSQLYAMQNTGQTGGAPGADIRATAAWSQFTGAPNLKIGVIDTGVDYSHPDLAANVWTNPDEIPANGVDDDDNGYVDDVHGYDFSNRDGDPMDDNGHGTQVAGIIAAVGNNDLGVVGVNWQAKLVAIKFLDANGSGFSSDAIDAIQYAITVGAQVTNNSWGGGPFSQALLDAIDAAGAAGQLFVAAAANGGNDNDLSPVYPASYNTPYVIAVAASDHNDALAAFSNFGQTSVDLAAPGVDILSTVPGGNYGPNSGTSMAVPHVTGAVALVRGRFPAMSPLQAKDVILNSVDPLPAFAGKVLTGGRLDLFRALDLDSIPPGSVTDLAAVEPGSNTVRLTWIAPGDDGGTGRAARYDIRYSTTPITEAGFADATSVPGPDPQVAGSPESLLVAGLAFSTTYYFALKAFDEFDNASLSNLASATTLGIPDFTATPASFSQGLPTGGGATQTLTLKNDGAGTLDFTIPVPEFLGPPGWLTVQPDSGRIAAADSMPVQLQFNALGLGSGDYNANVRVLSNDPNEGSAVLPVTLHVIGAPHLAVNPVSLDFGTLFPGGTRSRTLTVSNPGTDTLVVSGITSNVPAIAVTPMSFTLAPAGLRVVTANWSPAALGPLAGALTLNSNDPDQPSREVAVSGDVVTAPDVTVTPSSLSAVVTIPASTTRTLTIGNPGGSPFVWSARVTRADSTGQLPPVITDPVGDGGPVELHFVRGDGSGGVLQVEMEFATPIVPAEFIGFLWFDTDRNRNTGVPPSFGIPGQDIGVEFELQFRNLPSGTGQLYRGDGGFIGDVPVQIGAQTLRFAIPLTSLDDDDGSMDVAGLVGMSGEPTDWFPDSGHGTILAAGWLSADPDSGVVAPGGSAEVQVGLSTAGLAGGVYTAGVAVTSNGPGEFRVSVPVTLTAVGSPDIAAQPASLDFGSLFVGLNRDLAVQLSNPGGEPLEITAATVAGAGFALVGSGFPVTVPPGGAVTRTLRFSPSAVCAPCAGSLSLVSNDPDENPFLVPLTGVGLSPPDIGVSPTSVSLTLPISATGTRTLSITNSGGSNLNFATGPVPHLLQYQNLALAKGEADPRPGILGGAGPDQFGYHWRDSDAPGGPAFQWVDITGVGTALQLVGDDRTATGVPIGFAFPFYGGSFSTVNVCTNGFLSFTNPSAAFTNSPLPSPGAPENLLAPFWGDLFVSSPRIYTYNDGTRFIVSWVNVDFFGSGGPYTFQVILYPDGRFAFQYLTMAPMVVRSTIGIQNATRDDGLTVVFNAPYLHDSLAVKFARAPQWLTVLPDSGVVTPGGSADLQLGFNTTGLAGGVYTADVDVTSNDPDESTVSVPVTLNTTVPVVSQVYGGGGNTGAPFKNDYIELFNRATVAVSVAGWSVQYASATGSTWQTTLLSGTIPAGGYYLIQEAAGAGGGASLPTPDASGAIAMSLSAGKVALVTNSTPLTGTCPSGGGIVDLVGYGAANCSETSPTGVLSNTTADFRHSGGCDDTDNNLADFTAAAPAPRNSATALHSCQHMLAMTVDPPGSGSVARVPDQGFYSHGSSVQLTATAVSGYHFVSWSGGATGSTNPVTVVMDADRAVVAQFAPNASGGLIVISQIYGGGGNTGAPYHNDYIELFNRGNNAVDISGWSVQYAASAGSTWTPTGLSGTIPAGGYYLIQEAVGAGGGASLPTPNASGGIPMSLSAGKVALVTNSTPLTGPCPSGGGIVDLVGYGAANCSETGPTGVLSNTTADFRHSGGCDDTDNNLADFTAAAPAPRNSATPIRICVIVAVGDTPATEFSLGRPAPNPVSGMLHVPFALPREAEVQLDVVDIQGRVVARLVEGTLPSGQHEVMWNGTAKGGRAKSGVYFIRLQMPGRAVVRRVIIMR